MKNKMLLDACRWKDPNLVKKLLDDNSEGIDITYSNGRALSLAVANSSTSILDALLSYYEKTKLKGSKESFEYKEAKHKLQEILQEIIENHDVSEEILERLKDYIQIEEDFTPKSPLIDKTPELSAMQAKSEQALLHYVAGEVTATKGVLSTSRSVPANIVDDIGASTPTDTSNGGSTNSMPNSSLPTSISRNKEAVTLHLDTKSMNPIMKPANDITDYKALHMAIQGSHNNIAKQILDEDPKLAGVQDEYGQTALHWAVAKGDEEAVTLLLQKMNLEDIAKVTTENNYHALHVALHTDDTHLYNHNIVKQILYKFPKLASIPDKYGQTPLHWAASNGITLAVIELLDILKPEEVYIRSYKGSVALDLAKTEEIRQILELGSLEDYILERDLELLGNDDI